MTGVQSKTNASKSNKHLGLSRARRVQDTAAFVAIGLGTLLVLLPLFLILSQVIVNGLGAITPAFFAQSESQSSALTGGGGVLNAIVGSLQMLLVALAIGVSLGLGTGVYLAEYHTHRFVPVVRVMSDVLTGIPAIVVGLVVYGLLVATKLPGYSALAGGVALGLMMIPIVVRSSEEVLKLVPNSLREAGLALGLPRWKVIVSIVLPAGRNGIVTGIMLALARVSGEAAPLLFTALGNPFLRFNPLEPQSALPLTVYNFAFRAINPEQNRMAWAGALVLMLGVLVLGIVARAVANRK